MALQHFVWRYDGGKMCFIERDFFIWLFSLIFEIWIFEGFSAHYVLCILVQNIQWFWVRQKRLVNWLHQSKRHRVPDPILQGIWWGTWSDSRERNSEAEAGQIRRWLTSRLRIRIWHKLSKLTTAYTLECFRGRQKILQKIKIILK